MIVFEFKCVANKIQYQRIDEAIRITQFIRNKCLRYWMDNSKKTAYDLNKYTAVLAKEFNFANNLNSMARQAASERCWGAINRYFANCKAKKPGKKEYPKFQKNCRSVEYKTTGWKLTEDKKYIIFTDKCLIGKVKLIGTYDLHFYQIEQIKRVRIIKRSDGYYIQFCLDVERNIPTDPTNRNIGIDVGLNAFYTDSEGNKIENPRYLRKSEKALKRLQRKVSRKKKGSNNRKKAVNKLGRKHLKVSRQRKDFVVKTARCVIKSSDLVAIEAINVLNMVKHHRLAKSINDVSWRMFIQWLEYFACIYGKVLVKVNPQYTSQKCSNCGQLVKKTLSVRTHICSCGFVLDRDENAAINILRLGLKQAGIKLNELDTVGHTGINAFDGENLSTLTDNIC